MIMMIDNFRKSTVLHMFDQFECVGFETCTVSAVSTGRCSSPTRILNMLIHSFPGQRRQVKVCNNRQQERWSL